MADRTRGTLELTEPHPAAVLALNWLQSLPFEDLTRWQSAFSSCAIEGNRLAEICSETLYRYMNGEPISDRYLLGLTWAMRYEPESAKKSGRPEGKGKSKKNSG